MCLKSQEKMRNGQKCAEVCGPSRPINAQVPTFFWNQVPGPSQETIRFEKSEKTRRDGTGLPVRRVFLITGSCFAAEPLRPLPGQNSAFFLACRATQNGPLTARRCWCWPPPPPLQVIYVAGGKGPSGLLTTVERYDPNTGQWTLLSSSGPGTTPLPGKL